MSSGTLPTTTDRFRRGQSRDSSQADPETESGPPQRDQREDVRREVAQILEGLVVGESTPMNLQERERLAQEVLDEVFGLGPLEPLLADPTVSDILVNTYKHVYVERKGMLELTSDPVPRRRALDEHHRPNCFRDRPPRG